MWGLSPGRCESLSLAWSVRPGPEDWQETEESALFFLNPQTHVSLVLFFRLQDPELGFFLALVFFLLSFALPFYIQSKALRKWRGHRLLLQVQPRRLSSVGGLYWSILERLQQESSLGLLLGSQSGSSLWAAGTHVEFSDQSSSVISMYTPCQLPV